MSDFQTEEVLKFALHLKKSEYLTIDLDTFSECSVAEIAITEAIETIFKEIILKNKKTGVLYVRFPSINYIKNFGNPNNGGL